MSDFLKEELKKNLLNQNSISELLDSATQMARRRSLENVATEFGVNREQFFSFPDMYKRFHPPNPDGKHHFMIPKWYANRYAKIWIVMFPARVNYLVNIIKTGLQRIYDRLNLESGLEAIMRKEADALKKLSALYAMWRSGGGGLKIKAQLQMMLQILEQYESIKGNMTKEDEAYYDLLKKALTELAERYIEGPISKVWISSVQQSFPERYSVFLSATETIPFLQFFGSDVYFMGFSGTLPNTINIDGKNTMIKAWINKLRGSALLAHWQVAVLDFEDTFLYFYPIRFDIGQGASNSTVGFNMSAIVTRMSHSPISIPPAQQADDLNDTTRGELNDYFGVPREQIELDLDNLDYEEVDFNNVDWDYA